MILGVGRGRQECPTLEHNARPAWFRGKVMGYFNFEGDDSDKEKKENLVIYCMC